jgi:uncharacterized integral membrane protein (TIGR00697 family)
MNIEKRTHKFLPVISGLFIASLLISCTIASKPFFLGPFTLSTGIVIFPLAYLFGDILTEVYGYDQSRRVIWTGIFAEILMAAIYQIAVKIPPASFWSDQGSFEAIFNQTPRVVIASISACFLGEFCNSYTLAKMKVWSKGNWISIRFAASTVVGQGVDSAIFFPIAFLGYFPAGQLIILTLSSWLFKVLWELIALPLTLPIVAKIKKAENQDHFDSDTNFSPFSFDN